MEGTHIALVEQVVRIRAEQLRDEGTGYLNALNQIADEMYRQIEVGKDTPIGDIQPKNAGVAPNSGAAVSDIPWSKLPWKEIVGALNKALELTLKGRTDKKAKLEEIRRQVTPWVAEVYQGKESF